AETKKKNEREREREKGDGGDFRVSFPTMMVFDRRRLDRFIFGPPWSFNGRICGYQLDSR
ncbi:unnamed protein product, partial [Arabidopsis halleri]